jgi:hypothetical protein
MMTFNGNMPAKIKIKNKKITKKKIYNKCKENLFNKIFLKFKKMSLFKTKTKTKKKSKFSSSRVTKINKTKKKINIKSNKFKIINNKKNKVNILLKKKVPNIKNLQI